VSTAATETATETAFEKFLQNHDEEAWSATVTTLLRSIHEVDKPRRRFGSRFIRWP